MFGNLREQKPNGPRPFPPAPLQGGASGGPTHPNDGTLKGLCSGLASDALEKKKKEKEQEEL